MHLIVSAAVIFLVACAVVNGRVIATRSAAPAGWSLQCRANSAAEVTFFLAVKQQHLEELERKFWAVSDPKSSEYRQFLSAAEIGQIIAPKAEDMSAVMNWLIHNGVSTAQITQFVDAFEVRTTAAVAERLFETEIHEFHHALWDRTVLRQFGSFSLPSQMAPLIDLVIGLSNFPQLHEGRSGRRSKLRSSATSASGSSWTYFGVVAQTCYQLYNIPTQTQQNASDITSQAVIEFVDQSFSPSDLQKYAEKVSIPITPLTNAHIVGKNMPSQASDEGSLDLQFIATVNIEAANWFWLEDDTAWLYGFTTHFFNTADVPQVISISYGYWEGGQCDVDDCRKLNITDSDQYVARVNSDFMKIGLRGVSILVASGDAGAHTRSDSECEAKTLRSDFPAASSYVTSVGATQLIDEIPLVNPPKICSEWAGTPDATCAGGGTEVAASFNVSGFGSGGGFSEMSDQPAYQTEAVKAYLSSGVQLPPASMYNSSKRAHPDVSAVGNFNILLNGGVGAVSGTSASAPIFAAVAALLNQASIAKSGKPLGFLNPLLYQIAADNPAAFNDITQGDNRCTDTGCFARCQGFRATVGWDPVTGLGTPNYAALLQEVEKIALSHTPRDGNGNGGSAQQL